MQKCWLFLRKHSKKIGAGALVLALLVTLGYMAIPRRNDMYRPGFDTDTAWAYIREYNKALPINYDQTNEKDAFSFDIFPTASYIISTFPQFILESNIIVRGRIRSIEHVPQIDNIDYYLAAGGRLRLQGGPYVFYDLQVTGQLMGNLGLNRNIRVMLHGTPDTRANARLAEGDEVVFMLVETLHQGLYYSTFYEHGLFEINADGTVYAFSNFQYICDAYDGQPAKKLLNDIKTMKRKMGLW